MTTDQTQRPRYFEGQYLGSKDLTSAVEYARQLTSRHALADHTWGISIGLELREVPKPGGSAKRVDVILEPGYAVDGFGRVICVLAPYKIPEALFDAIKYDASIDGAGDGRLIEIWLLYDEVNYANPAPGFESCDSGDQTSRVLETFRVAIGPRHTHLERHDPVVVGGKSADAEKALKLFDPNAPAIYDESIPQQSLPTTGTNVEWLIPVGYVRWLPVQNGAGSFILHPADDDPKIRAFRHYSGVVADSIEAADGAIRLRDRTRDPSTSLYQPPAEELVNVEGHMRIEGDLRLADGALAFRAEDGSDEGTPLQLQRSGDKGKLPTDTGDRALELVLGPDSQSDNRFSIGPAKSDGSFDPKVTVRSDGAVGVGTTDPDRLMTLYGDSGTFLNVKANDGKQEVLLGADSNGGIVSTMTDHDLLLRAGSNSTKVIIKASGDVGVGTESPAQRLHVVGDRIRLEQNGKTLDLRTDGSEVDLQSTTNNLYLRSSGPGGKNNIIMNHAASDGNVGIGLQGPAEKLHVAGDRIRLEQNGKTLDLRTDGSEVDLQSTTNKLYLRSSGAAGKNQIIMNPSSTEGGIGIGTSNPQCKLHVANNVSGAASNVDKHVAVIENTATDTNADTLALKVGIPLPTGSNNFITFFGGGSALASIEGNYLGGVTYRSAGADYAESLPCLDETESIEAGDVVGIIEGKVTRRTTGTQHLSVVTDRPVVVANSPRAGREGASKDVAFIGQVLVRVDGAVRAGDYIVPSGKDDGVGVAVPAEQLTPEQAVQIVAQAWETAQAGGAKRVLAAVGLPVTGAAVLRLLSEQLSALQREVAKLKR